MSNNRLKPLGGKEKCSCKGYNLDKLLQPNILILLATQELHGYLIIQELESKDLFRGERADNTGIYRTLKTMEDKGLVDSELVFEATGPAKKVYRITEDGLHCLENWIDTLENYKNTIDEIVAEAREAVRSKNGSKTGAKYEEI